MRLTIAKWLNLHTKKIEPTEPKYETKPMLSYMPKGLVRSGFCEKYYETQLTRLQNHAIWTVGEKFELVDLYQALKDRGHQFINDWKYETATCTTIELKETVGFLLIL